MSKRPDTISPVGDAGPLVEDAWDSVGFQTKKHNAIGHTNTQKSALEHVDSLLVQPKLGAKRTGAFTDEASSGGSLQLIDQYHARDRVAFSVFPSKMGYAGPREAVCRVIFRKTHWCTHVVVGRDHAWVCNYYEEFEAHDLLMGIEGIEPHLCDHAFFPTRRDGRASERVCPPGADERERPAGPGYEN